MSVVAILSMLLSGQTAPAIADGIPLGAIPRQSLPEHGCAAFLWSRGEARTLVAMASADPAQLRLSVDGTITDLPRDTQQGAASFGFSPTTEYRSGTTVATLVMTVTVREDLKDGAAIPEATLRLDRAGKDSVVLPVAGLIGCVEGGK